MIPTNNPLLYDAALDALKAHKSAAGRGFKGRFIQIFLGMKYYQNVIPSMFSNSFISTEVLQTLLDDLYGKASRPANDAVLALFEKSYLARTGLIGIRNTTPQNTWRNNFNLQKGIGCYAPSNDLASQIFLDEPRAKCKYLSSSAPGILSNGRCSLQPAGATYRNEDHRKWLQIDVAGSGYAVGDLLNQANFLPYVAPSNVRIPILPLIVALYHDSDPGLLVGQRPQVDVDDFRSDFNFSLQEFNGYFDDDPASQQNAALLKKFSSVNYSAATVRAITPATHPLRPSPSRAISPPIGPRLGTPVAPPAINTGFDAEQFASNALIADGWVAHHVSRQQLGYDLLATKAGHTRYIEVKSSLGLCTPSLTSREWQQANAHGSSYVLAIIENFNPATANVIYWVPGPATSCTARQSQTVNYAIARSSWASAAVAISSI